LAEFTGERVVPGEVDNDLWNEHVSRYSFVARLCRNKRVLDIGCGAGYGTAELARTAARATGLDIAREAVSYAAAHYVRANTTFVTGAGTALPFAAKSFDLVVAFEMIEHLDDWTSLLAEARRVLATSGQFVVSTPNKHFYAEFRKESGPNPFHVHEFEFEEFRDALRQYFPHVSMFVQNHGPAIVFQPVDASTGAQVRIEGERVAPEESNFFIAVCAASPQTGAPTYVHVPTAANVLRERGRHITKLEGELKTKDEWLEKVKAELAELHEKHIAVTEELEERNRWAAEVDAELEETRQRLATVHDDFAKIQAGYEAKIATLERESESQSRWAMETQRTLDEKIKELAAAVEKLDTAETTVKERTEWALKLNAEVEELRAKVALLEASRWVRLGRAIGLGPGERS